MGRRDARRARARGNARDGKAQNKTGSLGAGRGGDRSVFGPVVSLGFPRSGDARTFVCLGNRANPPSSNCSLPPSAAIIVSLSPRRRGADRRRYHVCSVECTRARKNKRKMPPPSDACSRGTPTECLSRDASAIFPAIPGARRSAALGRRRSARRVNVNGRSNSPFPKALHAGAFWREFQDILEFPRLRARQICGPK